MTTAKHTHYLTGTGATSEADVWATCLSLSSRGKYALAGEQCRAERDLLAALVGDGLLAELLRSDRPIRVDGVTDGYRIEEV